MAKVEQIVEVCRQGFAYVAGAVLRRGEGLKDLAPRYGVLLLQPLLEDHQLLDRLVLFLALLLERDTQAFQLGRDTGKGG